MLEIPCAVSAWVTFGNFEKPARHDLLAHEVEAYPELVVVIEPVPDHRPFLKSI